MRPPARRSADALRSARVTLLPHVDTQVRAGDALLLSLAAPAPLEALPEALPLDVVYEDDHVLVVNKAAHMVVHPSAGHARGTLVNAVLHHCALPAMRVASGSRPRAALFPDDGGDDDEDEEDALEGDSDDGAPPVLLAPAAAPAGGHAPKPQNPLFKKNFNLNI